MTSTKVLARGLILVWTLAVVLLPAAAPAMAQDAGAALEEIVAFGTANRY